MSASSSSAGEGRMTERALKHPVMQRTFAELWNDFEESHEMHRVAGAVQG